MSLSHIHGILNIFIKCHFSRMRTSIKLGLCVNILIAELRGMFVAHWWTIWLRSQHLGFGSRPSCQYCT